MKIQVAGVLSRQPIWQVLPHRWLDYQNKRAPAGDLAIAVKIQLCLVFVTVEKFDND